MLNSTLSVYLIAVGCVGCATQPAGPTLGELLDKGAVRQSQAQVKEQLVGRKLNTVSPSGQANVDLTFASDGTFSGVVRSLTSAGAISKSSGTWTVDESGKWCMDETLHDWNMKNKYCHYMYFLDDKLIVSESANDRTARATVRNRSDLR